MQRIPIRDVTSSNKVKPRIFDLVKRDDSEEWNVEIQGKKGKQTVPLTTILMQIIAATSNRKPTEP
jgi:hypothetical protein